MLLTMFAGPESLKRAWERLLVKVQLRCRGEPFILEIPVWQMTSSDSKSCGMHHPERVRGAACAVYGRTERWSCSVPVDSRRS